MDMKERINDFIKRNGDFILIPDSCTILHESGATRDRNPYGYLKEPPTDDYERARLQLKFISRKLELASEEFATYKHGFLISTRNWAKSKFTSALRPEQKDGLAVLKGLKDKVTSWRKKENEAKVNLEKAKPEKLRQREADSEKNKEDIARLASTIESIEI
jgi:hypothetical protein